MKSWIWLLGGALGMWLLGLYPGWLLGGTQAMVQSGVALIICLVPSLATFWWALRASASPEKQLLATLGGSGIRIVTVPGFGCFCYLLWPEVFNDYFWIWIAIFYLPLLGLETFLVVRNKQQGTIS